MIDDVRLPEDVERGAVGGPGFRTSIVSLINARENRNQEWELARSAWNIGYGIQHRDDLEAVIAFFHARRGMARGFRFRDWSDFAVELGDVAAVVGNPLQRQLIKFYPDDVNPYVRIITHPVTATLKVYKDTILTTDYTLDANGILTFTSDPGANVLATFEFDMPARFDTDKLDIRLNTYQEGDIPSIPVVELRP